MEDTNENAKDAALARLRTFLSSHSDKNDSIRLSSSVMTPQSVKYGAANDRVPVQSGLDTKGSAATLQQAFEKVTCLPKILPGFSDYQRIKYTLQYALGDREIIGGIEAYDLKYPDLVQEFESCSLGKRTLQSWMICHGAPNSIDYLKSLPQTAFQDRMQFNVGQLVLDDVARKGCAQVILYQLAVGNSYAVRNEELDTLQKPPNGYQSYCLYPPPAETASIAQGDDSLAYRYQYIVRNPWQILPQFLVRFQYRESELTQSAKCSHCEKRSANFECDSCRSRFCTECDMQVHCTSKSVHHHRRVPLSQNLTEPLQCTAKVIEQYIERQLERKASNSECCKSHTDRALDFYCPICEIFICVHCKMLGDHSIGDKGSHRILTLRDAYAYFIKESVEPDTLSESRSKELKDLLENVTIRQTQVQENHRQIVKELEQKYQSALMSLTAQTLEKEKLLHGVQLELRRQIESIEYSNKFLHRQRDRMNASAFIELWQEHRDLQRQQRLWKQFDDELFITEAVIPDLELRASIEIGKKLKGESESYETKRKDNGNLSLFFEMDVPYQTHTFQSIPDPDYTESEEKVFSQLLEEMNSAMPCPGHEETRDACFASIFPFLSRRSEPNLSDTKSENMSQRQEIVRQLWKKLVAEKGKDRRHDMKAS